MNMACFLLTMRIFHCHVGLPDYIAKFSAKICPKQRSLVRLVACTGNDTHVSMKHDYGRKRSWCWVQYCVSPYRCISYWKRWMLQRHVRRPANFQGPSPVQAGAGLFHLSEGRLGKGWHAEFGQFPRSKRRNHEDGNGEHTKPWDLDDKPHWSNDDFLI